MITFYAKSIPGGAVHTLMAQSMVNCVARRLVVAPSNADCFLLRSLHVARMTFFYGSEPLSADLLADRHCRRCGEAEGILNVSDLAGTIVYAGQDLRLEVENRAHYSIGFSAVLEADEIKTGSTSTGARRYEDRYQEAKAFVQSVGLRHSIWGPPWRADCSAPAPTRMLQEVDYTNPLCKNWAEDDEARPLRAPLPVGPERPPLRTDSEGYVLARPDLAEVRAALALLENPKAAWPDDARRAAELLRKARGES